jgi:pyruvate dehydrogenase E1 component
MLRDFFEVDRRHIVVATLAELAQREQVDPQLCADAIERYQIDTQAGASWEC